MKGCAPNSRGKQNSISTARDLAGRSDPTRRNAFKGSIKFIPIAFLWNAQQAHALSMKIIFNLIDVLFGKNHFFEQFLINYLRFFISDRVIASCLFIKELNFNLYSVFICLFLEDVTWKRNANVCATKFQTCSVRFTGRILLCLFCQTKL